MTRLLQEFQDFMAAQSVTVAIGALLVGVLVVPLGTVVHEVAHVLVGRRHGVRPHAVVVAPEGPSLTFRFAGVPICLGLGLRRNVTSREPLGWVEFASGQLTAREAIAIFAAGPVAESVYWMLLILVGVLSPLPTLLRIMFVLGAINLAMALGSLLSNRDGSDGGMIRRLRGMPRERQLRLGPAQVEEAKATASVAPPPGRRPQG